MYITNELDRFKKRIYKIQINFIKTIDNFTIWSDSFNANQIQDYILDGILENEEELTNLSQQEPLQENNFIFRRRRTSIYLPPISTNNSNNYENTIITNQNPFRATNEIARSPSNIQNNFYYRLWSQTEALKCHQYEQRKVNL